MPAKLNTWIDPEHLALFRQRHATLHLTNSELLRYVVFLGCGYPEVKALELAKVKPQSMEHARRALAS